jgi:ATP-dependent helicase/nuclease subunit B
MLHLLTGSDRVALSARLLDMVCQAAARGEEGQILIVPEQFSHEAERRLCAVGGPTISRYAEVLSMSRLADRVAAVHGGAARSYLDKGGRLLAMALAAEHAAPRIRLFAAGLRRPEFLTNVMTMIEEFAGYCLRPEDLLHAAQTMEGQFAQKLEELALLYESYLSVCSAGSADPGEKLTRLADSLADSGWAAGKTFYVEGFSDFTGAELAVLTQLMMESRGLWVVLTTGKSESAVSRPIRETVRQLRALAESYRVEVETQTATEVFNRDQTVQQVLDGLFASTTVAAEPADTVRLRGFDSVEEECRHAALHVMRLAADGCRFRDIHVACTDTALYEAPLRAAFSAADLPFYFSGETDILGKPLLGAILTALTAATGSLDYEEASMYIKSGLPMQERDRCDRLDCYAYTWNLRGSQWERPLEFHPQGFGLPWTDDDRKALQALEADRAAVMSPLLSLRWALRAAANTGDMVLALHEFLESLQLRQRLEEQAAGHSAAGRGQLAQELAQLYEILCTSLEQCYLILGRTVRTPEDFCKLYRLLLTQYRVGTIPAGLDQIHISSVADLRQRCTPHLLLLGASDGSFPSYRTGEGLLTEDERRRLLAKGISMAPSRADQMDREMSAIHSALSAAEKSLWMSYSGDQPAWLFRKAEAICPWATAYPRQAAILDLPTLAACRVRANVAEKTADPDLDAMEQALRQLRDYEFTSLSEETVHGLYGRQIYLSASRIDKYAACRFSFFLSYGLKAKPRRKAELDPSAYGTLVHEVMEKTVRRIMQLGGFHTVSEETLLQIALEEIDDYAARNFPEQAVRATYLFRRSRVEILAVVKDLGEELRQSLFRPESVELDFKVGGTMPPIEIQGKKASCRISGFVDRVDLYEKDGRCFVRVVDYKTGHKDFDYTDILNGAGLQMLIYLFALRQYGGEYYGKPPLEPAGVLYLPARRDLILTPPMPDDALVAEKHAEARRRKGLILDNTDVLAAMEANPDEPRYMPYKQSKSGLTGDLASEDQMILLEHHVLRTLANMTDSIASGEVTPDPTVRGMYTPCRYCDYGTVCHPDLCSHAQRVLASTQRDLFWQKLEEEENRHG